MVHIVNAVSKKKAEVIALKEGAWEGCCVNEIDTTKKGCVFTE